MKTPCNTASSGNVFRDLELPDSQELLAKTSLAHQITEIGRARQLTQSAIAQILGTSQPKVSDLYHGKLASFSMERLMRFLNALGSDVEIVVSPESDQASGASIRVTPRESHA